MSDSDQDTVHEQIPEFLTDALMDEHVWQMAAVVYGFFRPDLNAVMPSDDNKRDHERTSSKLAA